MRVAIYARVSTKDQHCEMQLTDLRRHARIMEWEVAEYVEKASGKEGSARPVLDQLLADAHAHKFEAVLCWKIDRFGRSITDFLRNVEELQQMRVRLIVPSQGIDTDNHSPMGKFLVRLLSLLAELERDLIHERVAAGTADYRRAYAAGQIGKRRHSKSGKDLPMGRPRRVFDRTRALEMRRCGSSIRQVARKLNVGRGTVERLFREVGMPPSEVSQ